VRQFRLAERIAAGFDADILAIDGNPLEDLVAIRRLRAVYIGGLPVSPAPEAPAGVAVH
jgi:imidazolonepropionase-like amidohydrolase